jgi:hypothetical protein
MKKSKAEIMLETWLATLNYLDHHKIQGRILFVGVSAFLIFLGLHISSDSIVKIIEASK